MELGLVAVAVGAEHGEALVVVAHLGAAYPPAIKPRNPDDLVDDQVAEQPSCAIRPHPNTASIRSSFGADTLATARRLAINDRRSAFYRQWGLHAWDLHANASPTPRAKRPCSQACGSRHEVDNGRGLMWTTDDEG